MDRYAHLISRLLGPAASSRGQHEITIPAGLPQYCFDGLSPEALYTATVFVQTPNLEGPGVGVREKTRKSFHPDPPFTGRKDGCLGADTSASPRPDRSAPPKPKRV